MPPDVLADRTWAAVEEAFTNCQPVQYAILDDFLSPSAYSELHEFLLSESGWTFNRGQAQSRYLARPNAPQAQSIARSLREHLPGMLSDLELVEHWAFLHPRSTGLRPHFDVGLVTLNLWLTDDQYNRTPDRGGLVLYRVRRPADPPGELTARRGWSDEFFNQEHDGTEIRIAYRCNRAVLFPSALYHASDEGEFAAFDLRSSRMNLTFLFDEPAAYDTRRTRFGMG